MATMLGSIQNMAKRDGKDSSRQWVKEFAENKFTRGLLPKTWNGTVNPGHPKAIAFIDTGRWIAACPFCGQHCMVDPDDDFFFCLYCAGDGTGEAGKVVFPDQAERDQIEAEILNRPIVTQGKHKSLTDELLNSTPIFAPRNWKPGQTVDEMKNESQSVKAKKQAELIEINPNGNGNNKPPQNQKP